MPNTVTAFRYKPGTRWSRAAAAAMSTAGATSLDVLTVIHGLSKSPTNVTVTVRTVVAAASGGVPQPVVDSWNASVVILRLPASDGGAWACQVDVVSEVEHSFVS